jgi:hypothetical protein
MRLTAFIFLVLLYGCGQKTPEGRAKTLIKEMLGKVMDKPTEYQAVKFGRLDSAYTSLTGDSALMRLFGEVEIDAREGVYRTIQKVEDVPEALDIILDTFNVRYKHLGRVAKAMDSIMRNYQPAFEGWVMRHSFSVRAQDGHKELRTYDYYFDKDIQKIVNVLEISVEAGR